jgi:ATP-dependent exoDNAse (exonuclease V) beta subunit
MTTILDPLTFPLHGIRLIEASAGTGKTYTIAALYLRLVLGHGGENDEIEPLTPPQILVVTFTNAATEELRDRIRSRLNEAAAFFRGEIQGDAFLDALKNAYDAGQWPKCAGLLERSAQWMDESAIYTIHAWCRQMISQHAFDSGGLFDLDLTPRNRELLEEAACDYWRCHFYGQPQEIAAEIRAICNTPQDLLKKIDKLIQEPFPDPINPIDVIHTRLEAIETARHVWIADCDRAIGLVADAQKNKHLSGNKYQARSLDTWRESMRVWIQENGPLPDDKSRFKFSTSGLADAVNKNKTAPQHPAFDAMDTLNETLAELHIDTALFSHAAADIARRVRSIKDRTSQMDFNDLLTRLHDALKRSEDGRLAHIIRNQFPVAMIDEFQDTDPIQYAIFRTIYHHGAANNEISPEIAPLPPSHDRRPQTIHLCLSGRGHPHLSDGPIGCRRHALHPGEKFSIHRRTGRGGQSRDDCLPEMEFLIAGHGVSAAYLGAVVNEHVLPKALRPRLQDSTVNGMLTGFIDLIFRHENRYYVLDYKSNHLGDDAAAYTFEAMAGAMLAHRYDIQYVIYTLALHRHLKLRLPDYDYEKHIGGAVYLFLRGVDDQGHGVFLDRPPQSLIESLDRAFAGKEAHHAD